MAGTEAAASTRAMVEAIQRTVCAHDETLKHVDEFIDGNGKPGAKERLGKLEDSTLRIEKAVEKIQQSVWALVSTIGGGVVLYFFTKLLPDLIAKGQ